MMNKNIFLATALCGLCFAPFAASANDKVEKVYNAQKYQQVCKGKSEGAPVSFAYRGIIWNGTCQQQFFPSSSANIRGDEPELYTSCSSSGATTATINGTQVKGKCALGFTAPRPSQMQPMQNQPQMQPEMHNQPGMQPGMHHQPGMQTQPGM